MSLRFSLTKKSILWMGKTDVIKIAKHNVYEMNLLNDHKNVFIPCWSHNSTWYHSMPRWEAPKSWQDYLRAIVVLKERLWPGVPLGRNPMWKFHLLNHLSKIYPSKKLKARVLDLPDDIGTDRIHGDATLDNVVTHDTLVRWIDPCYRQYLPADRRVDIAKMKQTCWNFEGVIHRKEKAKLNESYWVDVMRMTEVSPKGDEIIETWLCVHLARLLRYQSRWTRKQFTEVLSDHYSCSL